MYLEYDQFAFNTGETMISFFGQARRYNQRGRAQSMIRRMVVEGEIVAAGQDAINTRMAQIQDALSVEGGSVVFRKDDGSATRYFLDGPSSRGVRILELAFHQQDGKAHFATGLPFSITFEAEYGLLSDGIVSYEETVGRIGNGGPRTVWQELDSGESIEQTVSTNTPVVYIQQGTAVGAYSYPQFPPPLYGVDSPDDTAFKDAPIADGFANINWPIHWNYRKTVVGSLGLIGPNYLLFP